MDHVDTQRLESRMDGSTGQSLVGNRGRPIPLARGAAVLDKSTDDDCLDPISRTHRAQVRLARLLWSPRSPSVVDDPSSCSTRT